MAWVAARASPDLGGAEDGFAGGGTSGDVEPDAKRPKVAHVAPPGGSGSVCVGALVTGSLYMVGGCLEELTKLGVTNHIC